MGKLTMTAVVNGKTYTREEITPDAGDAAVEAWALAAYPRPADLDEALPWGKDEAFRAAMGVLDNVKRHAEETAVEATKAAVKAQLAGLEPVSK